MTDTHGNANYSRLPFLFFATAFAAGITAGELLAFPTGAAFPLAIGTAAAAFFAGRGRWQSALLLAAFIFAGAFGSGAGRPGPDRYRNLLDSGKIGAGEPVELTGVIDSDIGPRDDAFEFTVELEQAQAAGYDGPASGRIRLFAPARTVEMKSDYRMLELGYGDRIVVIAAPDREEPFRNPGTENRVRSLDASETDAAGTLRSPLLVRRISSGSGPLRMLYALRRGLVQSFRDRFSAPTAGVLSASLLGGRELLDKSTAEIFRDGGTFHVLVISGLHVTFIGSLLLALLEAFGQGPWRRFLITSGILWIFALAVGAEVPVVRAALMFTVLLFGRALFRQAALLNLLGLCAFVILVRRPADLFSPSFQLTFASVAAIVGMAFPLIERLRAIGGWKLSVETPFPPSVGAVTRRFCEMLYWRPEEWEFEMRRNIWSAKLFKPSRPGRGIARSVGRYLIEGLIVSLAVQIALLPYSVIYFNRVAYGSVVLNLWVGAVLAAESVVAIAAVAAGTFSETVALPLTALAEALNLALTRIPAALPRALSGSLRLPAYSGIFAVVYVVFHFPLLVAAFRVNSWDPFSIARGGAKSRIGRPLAATACLAVAITLHPFSAPAPDGRLRIDFLDVGQGDSALITFPDGTTMLVDGGGRPSYPAADGEPEFEPDRMSIGEAVVSRFLWSRGLSKVDFLVATHADADHIQGLADIARNFEVGMIFFGREAPDDADFAALWGVARERGITTAQLARGDSLAIAGVRVDVLHPERGEVAAGNDGSVVLRVVFGERAVLLTGDIEQRAEQSVLGQLLIASDLVKVAHHGSRTSSIPAFVDATGAREAVISVGRDSPFGHPHDEIVERWLRSGARVVTTGEAGTVTIVTDGREFNLTAYVAEKGVP